MLLTLYRNIRFSLNQRFELELLLTRLTQLDALISPTEMRDALQEMRAQFAGSPGVRITAAVPPSAPPAAEGLPDPALVIRKIGEALRREKPALSSALDRATSVSLDREDLIITFSARDRFQGEVVQNDKDMLTARIAALMPSVKRVRCARS